MGEITKPTMRQFTQITRPLADETRRRVLLALRGRALCACQITGGWRRHLQGCRLEAHSAEPQWRMLLGP